MIEVKSSALSFVNEQTIDPSSHFFTSGSRSIDTEVSRRQAVEQAITMMRARFQDNITLADIADSAQLSPFHFNRIFRSITGMPPGTYLAALRIAQAKTLLLRTERSVTCICFDVGYNSLGTFVTRFTRFVGTTPSQLRRFSRSELFHFLFQNWDILKEQVSAFCQEGGKSEVAGYIDAPQPFNGLILIGLFADPVPQGTPVRCTVLTRPGRYSISSVPNGTYYLFAVALVRPDDPLDLLEARSSLRCSSPYPVSIQSKAVCNTVNLHLSPMCWTDAPILITLPWFLASRIATFADGVESAVLQDS